MQAFYDNDLTIEEAGKLELARELLDLSYQHSGHDQHLRTAKAMVELSGLNLPECWKHVLTVSDQRARANK